MVTEDRGFYCGGGVNASLDLSVYLVERFCGHEIAMQTAKALLIEMPRAWQAGFAIVPLKTDHTDDNISSAQEWLHKNFQKTFSLEDPARRVGMSVRNFVRRFKEATGDSPLIYLQKLRIAAAKRMLESNHRSMQEISDAVGYQDAAFFRSLFQRHTATSPVSAPNPSTAAKLHSVPLEALIVQLCCRVFSTRIFVLAWWPARERAELATCQPAPEEGWYCRVCPGCDFGRSDSLGQRAQRSVLLSVIERGVREFAKAFWD